jgi:hypothetical protein
MFPLKHICFLGLCIMGQWAMAQDVDQEIQRVEPVREPGSTRVPFKMVNKLILLPVQINGSDTLQFILDSRLENSIICELEANEVLELKQAREVQIGGIGSIDAIQSSGNSLRVGDLTIPDQDCLVLSNNVLQLSSKMGARIHGLLNMHAFEEYIVEIDYDHRYLILYQPAYFREHYNLEGYASIRMDILNGAPCIEVTIFTNKGTSCPVELMLDVGTGNALSLNTGSLAAYSLPERSLDACLGYGFNGNVKGKVGRIKGVEIGPYHLKDVLVSLPESQEIAHNESGNGRNGSLGSEFLRRFNMIIDYPEKMIHIKANKAFDDEFHYDMSGLEIQVPVPDEHRYIITGVQKQSRAGLAGIMSGDEILSINGTPCIQLGLDEIYKCFLGSDGKKIRLELLREDKRIRASFRLKKYI